MVGSSGHRRLAAVDSGVPVFPHEPTTDMKQHAGLVIGVIYLFIAMGAFRESMTGWQAGHSDLGFWWMVIGTLLGIAGLGALIGTWIHAWSDESH